MPMQAAASGMPYDLTLTGQPVMVPTAANDSGQPVGGGMQPGGMTIADWLRQQGYQDSDNFNGGLRTVDPSNQNGSYYDQVAGGTYSGPDFSFDYTQLPGYEQFVTRGTGGVSYGGADPIPDKFDWEGWSKANPGYTLQSGNLGGRSGVIDYVVGPNGQLVGNPTFNRNTSLSDMRNMALVVAGGYLGGSAAFGGAGSAPIGAGAAGSTTAGTTAAEAAALDAAAIDMGAGATTVGAGGGGTTAAAGGMTAADAAALDAAAIDAGAGATTVGSGATTTTTGGGATTAARSGMEARDYIELIRLAGGLYAADQAGDRAEDANNGTLEAARGQLDLARQAQEWFQNTYESERGLREAAAQRQNDISDAQLEGMRFAIGQARDLDQYNRETFRPLEQQLVSEARTYDTPERRMQAAASAAADVDMGAAAARSASNRELQRAGVAPGSARALAMQADADIRHGAARGGAMTQAVRGVEQQGYARRADAANLGRGIATTQATQQQIATTAGNASAAAAGQGLGSATSGTPTMQAGFNAGLNGLNSAGNLFNAGARTTLAEDQMMMEGLGSIGSYLGSRYGTSDPKVKKGTGKMANAAKALKEVENTPVQEGWEYDESKGAPPGSGGRKMIGPMATDVQRVSGEASAPGGQVIDLVKAQGRMYAAVQELSRRMKKVESMVTKDAEEDENEEMAA